MKRLLPFKRNNGYFFYIPVLCVSFFLIFPGCRKQIILKYPNGSIKEIRHIKYPFGKTFDGDCKTFYENGKCKASGFYRNGKVQGILKSYYPSGTICNANFMRDNVKDGFDSMWYENGKLKYATVYKNGKLEGVYKEWDTTGKQLILSSYTNGLENGIRSTWYKNGARSEIGYQKGLKHGRCKIWHENGQLQADAYFAFGKPCGTSYAYDKTGALIETKQQSIPCDSTAK